MKTKGQIAYEAYCLAESRDGCASAPWDGLPNHYRQWWEAVAAAVQPQIDEAMVDRALRVYYGKINDHCITSNEAMRAALKAALALPPLPAEPESAK